MRVIEFVVLLYATVSFGNCGAETASTAEAVDGKGCIACRITLWGSACGCSLCHPRGAVHLQVNSQHKFVKLMDSASTA